METATASDVVHGFRAAAAAADRAVLERLAELRHADDPRFLVVAQAAADLLDVLDDGDEIDEAWVEGIARLASQLPPPGLTPCCGCGRYVVDPATAIPPADEAFLVDAGFEAPEGTCAAHNRLLCERCVADSVARWDDARICPARVRELTAQASVGDALAVLRGDGAVVEATYPPLFLPDPSPVFLHAARSGCVVVAVGSDELRELAVRLALAEELGGDDPYSAWCAETGFTLQPGELAHADHAALAAGLGDDPPWLRRICAGCSAACAAVEQ